MILESLNAEKNSSRTVHTVIINSDRTSFSLGRGHDSDLRINDISVSRKHASLEYRDGSFYFVDLKSKFGTLALLSDDVELIEQNSQTFQIGRTVVTLKAKQVQPWKSKDRNKQMTDVMFKDPNMQDKFLQDSQALLNNKDRSPTSVDLNRQDKIQNPVPFFNVNSSKNIKSDQFNNTENMHQILEIDGKRYLVIQELDVNPPEGGQGEEPEYEPDDEE